jgi:hypothetical protein
MQAENVEETRAKSTDTRGSTASALGKRSSIASGEHHPILRCVHVPYPLLVVEGKKMKSSGKKGGGCRQS